MAGLGWAGLDMGWGSPWYPYRVGDEGMEGSPAEKDLGVLGGEKLPVTQQCALAAQQPSRAPGCIPTAWAQGEGGDSAPLC